MKTLLFLSAVLLPTSVFAAPAVSKEAAAKTALAAVPAGTVKSSELETERGRQFYSFDIVVPGKTGVEEVHVSAATGRVLSRKHEGPLKERAEHMMEPNEHKPQ